MVEGVRAGSKEASPAKPGKLDVESFVPETGDFDNFLEEEDVGGSLATSNTLNGTANLDSRYCFLFSPVNELNRFMRYILYIYKLKIILKKIKAIERKIKLLFLHLHKGISL